MLIDGQKYSCEACIRGHRVTTCKHHDRPLTKINRKGRPFSTCSICHRTPCAIPDEHLRLRREVESRSHHKKSNGRYSRPFQGFLPIAPRPKQSLPDRGSGLESGFERRLSSSHTESTNHVPEGINIQTSTTRPQDIPSTSLLGLSESLLSTSSIASSASLSSSSSSAGIMPIPLLDLPLDLELELPLPILDNQWDNPDLGPGLGLDVNMNMGMEKDATSLWSGLDQAGLCGLDDMAVCPGQAPFWVGEL